jgi:hypothetical protein
MVAIEDHGVPWGGTLASASSTEIKLIEATLEEVKIPHLERDRRSNA